MCFLILGKARRESPGFKEKMKAYQKKWNIENKEKQQLAHRNFYLNNKEKIVRTNKKRRELGLFKPIMKRANHNRRIRMKGQEGKFSKEELIILFNNCKGFCEYCGAPLGGGLATGKYELDHIVPVSKNGTGYITNIAISCVNCNRRKRDKRLEEFNAKIIPYFLNRNSLLFNNLPNYPVIGAELGS